LGGACARVDADAKTQATQITVTSKNVFVISPVLLNFFVIKPY
jgi:hypothetical protein